MAEFDLGSPVISSPVLVGSSIIVATEEGKVYALDTGDYQKRQLTNLEEEIHAPLFVSDGVIYIHSDKDTLYAVDAQSGETLWSLSLKS
jgi:outer membrane protein assembly factor BamB